MDDEQVKALQDMLRQRTSANTATPREAREWILQDGIHRRDGALLNGRAPSREAIGDSGKPDRSK